MSASGNRVLVAAIGELESRGVSFALVHESAIMAWGMDGNAFLEAVDVLVLDDASFDVLRCGPPLELGRYGEVELAGVPVRLWSRASLGLGGGFDVTQAQRYGCECAAPEVVLAKLPYSPDSRLLMEQRARLAAAVNVDALSDEELDLFAALVRGA